MTYASPGTAELPPPVLRARPILAIVGAVLLMFGGCGASVAYLAGVFADHGRFSEVDACPLLPPDTLAKLVKDPVPDQDGESHPPKGFWGGDPTAVCKRSSAIAGTDAPFRTVRVYTETLRIDAPSHGAPERAHNLWTRWRHNATHPGPELRDEKRLGEEAFSTIDHTSFGTLIDIFDVHAKFRVSNLVVDVSARTQTEPTEALRAQVVAAARQAVGRLPR
jgi:hypothetical protein